MKFICPLIVVEDLEKSKQFYENVLRQKIKYDFGADIVFEGDFAIHLESHFKELMGLDDRTITKRSNSFELYFETTELAEMHAKLINKGVEFVHGIVKQPWGQRVMRFYDPDGHMIEIGEPVDGLTSVSQDNRPKESEGGNGHD